MDNKFSQWWVEYIDDYNTKHLTLVQNKEDLKYLQNSYRATIIETSDRQFDFS